MSAMPSCTDALTQLPSCLSWGDCYDVPDDFMSRDSGVLDREDSLGYLFLAIAQ